MEPTQLALPFEGRWLVQNSPARRVPSHGTDLMGGRYAIDFVAVDDRDRTAVRRDWRTVLGTEPVGRFVGYGRAVLAPADGVVVATHDGEVDHEARRSPLTLLPYALSQRARLRDGIVGLAGNHVIIQVGDRPLYVALAHLRAGSVRVTVGGAVTTGQQIAECGNSGNSTQPHVHVQVMDRPDAANAQGLPLTFRNFREWQPRGPRQQPRADRRLTQDHEAGIPREGAVVAPLLA